MKEKDCENITNHYQKIKIREKNYENENEKLKNEIKEIKSNYLKQTEEFKKNRDIME